MVGKETPSKVGPWNDYSLFLRKIGHFLLNLCQLFKNNSSTVQAPNEVCPFSAICDPMREFSISVTLFKPPRS